MAKSSSAMTITILSPTCAHDEAARLQVKQLSQRKARAFGNWVEKWKGLIHG
jgi:hypothetical protein